MKLYSIELSPFAARVRAALYFMGLEFDCLAPAGGTRSAEFLSINPMGKHPALVLDDGTVLAGHEQAAKYYENAQKNSTLRRILDEMTAGMKAADHAEA